MGDAQSGLAPGDALSVSEITAQARLDHPEEVAGQIPHKQRKVKKDEEQVEFPTLALRGTGERLTGTTGPETLTIDLYLEKTNHQAGYADVGVEGEENQTWRIIAFDMNGDFDDESFEFIYTLAKPSGALFYMNLVGGEYIIDKIGYVGYEGFLMHPANGYELATLEGTYRIDFGYRFLLNPEYKQGIEDVTTLMKLIEKGTEKLASLSNSIQKEEDRLEKLQQEEPNPKKPEVLPAKISAQEAKISALEVQLADQKEATEIDLRSFYAKRLEISDLFAAFMLTNQYTWLDYSGKDEFFKIWQQVDELDRRAETEFLELAPYLYSPKELETARKETTDRIEFNNNEAKAPVEATFTSRESMLVQAEPASDN
ncbi:hypothetical protein ACFL6N_01260 [Thermodesulfobacteriota bacterium]